jgi:hypothetical protein
MIASLAESISMVLAESARPDEYMPRLYRWIVSRDDFPFNLLHGI